MPPCKWKLRKELAGIIKQILFQTYNLQKEGFGFKGKVSWVSFHSVYVLYYFSPINPKYMHTVYVYL